MLKRMTSVAAVILLLTMSLDIQSVVPEVEMTPIQHGPRAPSLEIHYYANQSALYTALLAGEIDIMGGGVLPAAAYIDSFATGFLTYDQYLNAITNPNIILTPVDAYDIFQFDFNNNETIATYPGVRNPLSDVNFRKALAHLVDKDVSGGFAERIDVPIPPALKSWWNTSLIGENYPYPYSLTWAATLLDSIGFTDTDGDGIRNYPEDWPGRPGRPNMDPIIFYARSDYSLKLIVGMHLRDSMMAVGIPVDFRTVAASATNYCVMEERNYHIYTGSWSLGRCVVYLYQLYHSETWLPGGSNYVTGTQGYTDLDEALERLIYAPTVLEAMNVTMEVQSLIIDKYAIHIPLWSYSGFQAYRNLLGVVNMQGYGIDNTYTWLNAYRADDPTQPIRIGTYAPLQLNPLYSRWVYDWVTLEKSMDKFTNVAPYNIGLDVPWWSSDWDVQRFYAELMLRLKELFYYYLEEGDERLLYRYIALRWWLFHQTVGDLHRFPSWMLEQIERDFTFVPLYDSKGRCLLLYRYIEVFPPVWWSFEEPMSDCRRPPPSPWMMMDLKKEPIAWQETKVFIEGINATTPGDLDLPWRTLGAPFEIDSITVDGVPLINYTDYNIVKGRIRIYQDIPDNAKITVTYWGRGDAAGYTPGGLPWNETFIDTGPWCMIDHIPGIEGCTIFEANRNYFLETPPLGEIDWRWIWVEGVKPRTGYFKVDIYDVVKVCAAYGSTGTGVPSINWCAEADLALSTDGKPGKIDLYDVVIICGKYGTEFGRPPS